MVPFLSRKRLVLAAAIAAATTGGAAGAVLAEHGGGAQLTAATAGPSQPAGPTPPAAPDRARGHRAHPAAALHLVKVVSLTGDQLVVADAGGAQTTFTLSGTARVVGPRRAAETLADLKPGELVVVVTAHRHSGGPATGAAAPTPAPQTSTGAATAATVTLIRDTGFRAA